MSDIGIITRTRDEARATLLAVIARQKDPCANCEDTASCELGYGCTHMVLRPCETPVGCEFCDYCEGGALCRMIRPEAASERLDLGARAGFVHGYEEGLSPPEISRRRITCPKKSPEPSPSTSPRPA
jgi:hypothetical protein